MPPQPNKPSIGQLLKQLASLYPEARCSLDHETPLQLLVATILSAQCTDALVNKITPTLFQKYPDVDSLACANTDELESIIQRITFFRTKARNVIACCQQILKDHQGKIPRTLEDLIKLPGVGRKTANVVLGNAFDIPGITVDTHVGRLSRRLGLTTQKDAGKVEIDLMDLIPKKEWIQFSHRMIFHGRQVCRSRYPNCSKCELSQLCPQIGVRNVKKG